MTLQSPMYFPMVLTTHPQRGGGGHNYMIGDYNGADNGAGREGVRIKKIQQSTIEEDSSGLSQPIIVYDI